MKNLYETPHLYDIFYNPDNEEPLRKHYQNILAEKPIKTIFDCSIGTGNLTYVLAEMGYEVSGSDISDEMLALAKEKSKDRNLDINLYQSDFRTINEVVKNKYDCLMTTGNSLAHVSNEDVKITLSAMTDLLNTGGYLYIDLRNWDKIIDEKNRFDVYNPLIKKDHRINVILLKDFFEDHINFNFIYAFERENKIYHKEEMSVKYYPLRKKYLIETLEDLGYEDVKIYNFINHKIENYDDMQWYALIGRLKE